MEELKTRDAVETPAGSAQQTEENGQHAAPHHSTPDHSTPDHAAPHNAAVGAGELEFESEGSDPISEPSFESEPRFGPTVESTFESESGVTSELEDENDVLVAEAVTEPGPVEDPHVRIKAVIEAAIYITEEPLTAEEIATAIEQPLDLVKEILGRLTAEYAAPSRGLTIRELAGGYKMSTKAEHHEDIRQFVRNLQPAFKPSLAALETLAVIAYKQPITGPEILDIRGVQGAGVLKTLLDRKLIATAGRKNVVGKPILYKTTQEFLVQFGLSSLSELPTLKEFEELGRLALNDSETADEPARNAGTTGFAERDASEGMIPPDLEQASTERSTEGDAVAKLAATEIDSESIQERSLSREAEEAQHAVEAEARPQPVTEGGGKMEETAQEVSQTHG
jgi:segregation and condensation protein B